MGSWFIYYIIFNILCKGINKHYNNKDYILWGDAIRASYQLKQILNILGTRGSIQQRQCKQTLIASVISINDNDEITNRKYIRSLLPHKNANARNEFINKCTDKKVLFNIFNDKELFVNDEIIIKRNSYVLLLYLSLHI